MFRRLAICAVSLMFFSTGHAGWLRITGPVNSTLRSCIMVDSQYGWATGDDGVIIHTSNGGISFTVQTNPVSYYTNDIFFLNRRLGWIVSNEVLPGGSTIITTTNGGLNWTATDFQDSTKLFRTVFFLDSLNGFLAGYGGTICKTTDGGSTWISAMVDTSEFSFFPITKMDFSNSERGYAVGGFIDVAGVIWQTTNSGLHWTAGGYSPEPFYDMFIRDENNIIAAGGDFEYGVQISYTINGGVNWTYNNLGIFGQAYSMDFRTRSEVWMATGYGQNWAISYDTARTWTALPVTDSATIYSLDFADSLHGFAVGADGVILRYDPGPNLVMLNSETGDSFSPSLSSYPNPFNPETNVLIELPNNGRASLQVFDISGRSVTTLISDQSLNSGNHSYKLDGTSLPAGAYFLKLDFISEESGARDFAVRRIILLK
jgi:photosystem II stability/assembly factor-like uncharacterized protein